MNKCNHTRKPLFTSDYCVECDAQPILQLPIPEPIAPPLKPATQSEIDPGNCINPFDVVAVDDNAIVENRSNITTYYKVLSGGKGAIELYLWNANGFHNMVYSNTSMQCDELRVSVRSLFNVITNAAIFGDVMIVSIRC